MQHFLHLPVLVGHGCDITQTLPPATPVCAYVVKVIAVDRGCVYGPLWKHPWCSLPWGRGNKAYLHCLWSVCCLRVWMLSSGTHSDWSDRVSCVENTTINLGGSIFHFEGFHSWSNDLAFVLGYAVGSTQLSTPFLWVCIARVCVHAFAFGMRFVIDVTAIIHRAVCIEWMCALA